MFRDGTNIEATSLISGNVSGYGTCVFPLCFIARTKPLIVAVIIHLSPEIQMQLSYRLSRHDAIMARLFPFSPVSARF